MDSSADIIPIHGVGRLGAAARQSSASALFKSPASRALHEKLNQLARNDATILIIGETGTGKEVAARYLHVHSARRSGPFVAVNCGALTDSLAEAELFGYEKGAYTGATRTQAGWFEAAAGGTLLLDEIGELPLSLQVKLLRVLQEREVTRIGSRDPVAIDVRIIAATNVDLAKAVAAKRFRDDLLFRLNVASFVLPPLRERGWIEIEALARHFVERYGSQLGQPNLTFSDNALVALRRHAWPGNIRELENVVHGAALLAGGPLIRREHLQLSLPSFGSTDAHEDVDLIEVLKPLFHERMRQQESDLLDRVMRSLVEAACEIAQGNQVKAAEYLGVSRHKLRTQLSHLGVIRRRPSKLATSRSSCGELAELRIGYQSYGTLSLLKVGDTFEQRLEQRGMRVSWLHFPAGPQLLEALHAGVIDFGATGEVPPIFAQANGAPLVYVGHDPPSPGGEALIVARDSPIRRATDLRGKRIALNKGSNVHYLLVQCLESYGLSIEDVYPVYVPPDETVPFVVSRAVDAAVAWDPYLSAAESTGNIRILTDGTGLVANRQFHVARAEFAARYPDVIRNLLDELRRITRSALNNPARAAHSLSNEFGIDSSSLEIAIRRLTHGPRPLDIGVIREQQKIADRFYALGLIPRAIVVRDAVWAPTA